MSVSPIYLIWCSIVSVIIITGTHTVNINVGKAVKHTLYKQLLGLQF